MKRIACFLMLVVMVMTAVSSLADITVINSTPVRDITIQKAGDNSVPDGVSPVTGRNLSDIEVPEGYIGMAQSGTYMPLLVQVTNSGSGIGNRAPWFASYADVVYESAKHKDGTTRYTMVFSDVIPEWVGCNRSIRVQHVWIREEWNGPFLYFGHQMDEANKNGNDVSSAIRSLGWHVPENPKSPGVSVFYDGLYDNKPWGRYRFRVDNMASPDNAVYHATEVMENVVSQEEIIPVNHTYLFSDTLPEGGDDAGSVYVIWNKNNAKDSNTYYFNTMLQYEPDEGVYYRWILRDMNNANNSELFEEMAPVNIRKTTAGKISCELTHGNPIVFSNIIVQHIDMKWIANDSPMATLTGTGNADYFMGGKHYSGVWNRDTLQERTVFYDENGQEMTMQRGKTLIILLDIGNELREIRYE